MLEIFTLGDLSIRLNGKETSGLASRKAEALLVYLAVTQQMQPREFLAALLWEEEQERALGNLRVALSSLRKALGPYIDIQHDRAGILPGADVRVDALELTQIAPYPSDASTYDAARSALSRYHGPFLQGFSIRNAPLFENWVTLEREHYRTVFDNKYQLYLDCLLDGGEWQEAMEMGEKWITLSQGHVPETAFRALMRATAGMSNLSGLSSVYQRCIQYLGEELGVSPSEHTQQLYAQLLAGRKPIAAPGKTMENPAQVVLDRWRGSRTDIDMAGLSLLYTGLEDLKLETADTQLIFKSVLHHGLDVRAWVEKIDDPENAVRALVACLEDSKQPYVRLQILDSLKRLPGERALQALFDLALKDPDAEVRAEAAQAAQALGKGEDVIRQLAAELQEKGNAAAVAPLVALTDAGESLPRLDSGPRLMVWLGVLRRRWERNRNLLNTMVLRSTLGAAVVSFLYGATRPFLNYLASPAGYYRDLEINGWTPITWMLAGAVGSLLIGGSQGLASGFAAGMADAVTVKHRTRWRILTGGIAGQVASLMVILFNAAGFTMDLPRIEVALFGIVVHGLIYGAGLSFLYPRLGNLRNRGEQLLRALIVTGVLLVDRVFLILVLNWKSGTYVYYTELVFVFAITFGIALTFSKRSKSHRSGKEV